MIGLNEIGKSLMNTEILGKKSDLKLQADKVFAGYKNSENIDISKPVFTKNEDAYKTINNNIPKNFEKQKIEPVRMNSQFEFKKNSDLDNVKKFSSIENIDKNQYTDSSKEEKEVKNGHPGLTEDEKRELKEETGVKYDDNGKIYKKNGDLLANTEYTIRGYNYKTDDQSRIISVQGDLHWKEHEGRLPLEVDIHTIGKGSERSDDDRGHLIADEFNGSNGIENLVPMNSELNRNGDYRKLEKEWEQALYDKQNVHVDIEPVYSDASKRPDKFIVKYTVDGEYYEKVIINRRETNV